MEGPENPNHEELAAYFRRYVDATFGEEPLYIEIGRQIAEDSELLDMLSRHPPQSQQPNLIFAAANYLLLSGTAHRLSEIYAGTREADPFEAFKSLIVDNSAEVHELLATRRTQTNEVGRCAPLLVGLANCRAELASRGSSAGLAWVDVGASAGLNLGLGRYSIAYRPERPGASLEANLPNSLGDDDHWPLLVADRASPVEVSCNLIHLGDHGLPAFPGGAALQRTVDLIDWSVGFDLAPIDVCSDSELTWLRACFWPSQTDRRKRLELAAAAAREHPPHLWAADAVSGVARAIEQAPSELDLVFTTSWVWYYFDAATKTAVLDLFREADRPVVWLSLEAPGQVRGLEPQDALTPSVAPGDVGDPQSGVLANASVLGLRVFDPANGPEAGRVVGYCHPHGRWLRVGP